MINGYFSNKIGFFEYLIAVLMCFILLFFILFISISDGLLIILKYISILLSGIFLICILNRKFGLINSFLKYFVLIFVIGIIGMFISYSLFNGFLENIMVPFYMILGSISFKVSIMSFIEGLIILLLIDVLSFILSAKIID